MKDTYTPMIWNDDIVVVVNMPELIIEGYKINKNHNKEFEACTKYPTLEEHAEYWKERIGQRVEVEIQEVDEQVRYDNGEYAREIQYTTYAIPPQQKQGDGDLLEELAKIIMPCIGTYPNTLVVGIASECAEKILKHYQLIKRK